MGRHNGTGRAGSAMAAVMFDGVIREKLEQALADGITAWVALYYRNYSDATRIEPDGITALSEMLDGGHIYTSDLDLVELISDAEQLLNDNGGVRSDTDGTYHTVCTYPDGS